MSYNERKVLLMENTNEKLTIKEKAKEIYRKNKPIINTVIIGVGAVGSWYIVHRLTKKDKNETKGELVDTNDDFDWGCEGYLGDGGRWFLEIPNTRDRGYKTLDEVIEDIKDGNYTEEML